MAATMGVTKVGPSTGICCKNANGGVCRTAVPGVGAVVTAATVPPTGTAAVDRACLRDTANAVSVAGESSGGVAGVFAGIGIGGLVGAVLSDRIGGLLPAGQLVIAILVVFAGSNAVMVLPVAVWWPMVPLLVTAVVTPALNVVLSVAVSRLVPHEMLGRLDAVLTVAGMGLSPLAPVLGGFLAAALGGAGAVLVIGVGFALTAVVAASSRELRRFTDDTPAARN